MRFTFEVTGHNAGELEEAASRIALKLSAGTTGRIGFLIDAAPEVMAAQSDEPVLWRGKVEGEIEEAAEPSSAPAMTEEDAFAILHLAASVSGRRIGSRDDLRRLWAIASSTIAADNDELWRDARAAYEFLRETVPA